MNIVVIKPKRKRGRQVTTKHFERINVRLPPNLYERIAAEADSDYTSINSVIIRRLLNSYLDSNAKGELQ